MNKQPDNKLEQLRKKYTPGTIIKLNYMQDPHPVEPGTKGEVTFVDDAGQIHMKWDCGSTLALQLDQDSFEIIPTQRDSDLAFLRGLQEQMRYESEHDYDMQASPRFWVLMDYRTVPGAEGYDNTEVEYHHHDGDYTKFETFAELKEFILEHELADPEESEDLQEIFESGEDDFDELWEYVEDNLNKQDYFNSLHVKEESFLVPNTMFLTKKEAKEHIKRNHYHYTSKVHTYAMTAIRAPQVERLLKILHDFDFSSEKEGVDHAKKEG